MHDNLTRIACHEAGHTVIALALGHRVTSARASANGGIVHADEPADWQHQVILDLSGLAAEEALLGEASPEPSHEDIELAQRHNGAYGNRDSFKRLRETAISLAWQYREEICSLAHILAEREHLNAHDIAKLTREQFTQWQYLYPAPADWQNLQAIIKVEGTADKTAKVLRSYIVAEEGEFKDGRGAFDQDSLRQIATLINASPDGVRSRFGHPSMFSDGIGTFLGRTKNAKVGFVTRNGKQVSAVRADLHFNPAAAHSPVGDLITYVLKASEADSGALSASLVIRPYEVSQGNRPPLWYPEEIAGVDLVDIGAATGSLLAAGEAAEPKYLAALNTARKDARWGTAIHEAAHVIAAHDQGVILAVGTVTIRPSTHLGRKYAGSVTWQGNAPEQPANAIFGLAGAIANTRVTGRFDGGESYGDRICYEPLLVNRPLAEQAETLDNLREKAAEIVNRRWNDIEWLATELIQRETIRHTQLQILFYKRFGEPAPFTQKEQQPQFYSKRFIRA